MQSAPDKLAKAVRDAREAKGLSSCQIDALRFSFGMV